MNRSSAIQSYPNGGTLPSVPLLSVWIDEAENTADQRRRPEWLR